MKKSVCAASFIILCFFFFGCVAPQRQIPLSKEASETLNGKTCEISKPKTPDFYAQTTGKAWLPPMIGMAASFSAGREIVEQNQVEDPAIFVSEQVAKILKEKYSINLLPNAVAISESNDIDTLCKTYTKGDILLDVRTLGWAFGTGAGSNPALSAQYQVSFILNLKIIDIKAKQVLAEEIFGYPNINSPDGKKTFSYEELLNDNAAGIKKELRKGTEEAILFFKEKTFNL
jgi:hypothetical protein